MAETRSAAVRALLGAEVSPLRGELAALVFEGLAAQPLADWVDRGALHAAIVRGLTRANAALIASRHVLPAIERTAAALKGRSETLAALLSPAGESAVRALVRRGEGPRYGWLRGAIDGDALRQLIAPIVQQLLLQFTTRLPIPGLGMMGGSGLGGIVGRLGKQVQRSAGQLADVGRSVFGGVIREFSETATQDFRAALAERLKSPDGQRLLERMRERFVDHVLAARADEVVADLMRLPRDEIAAVVATVLDQQREQPLFRERLEAEIEAVLGELAGRSLRELLSELDLYEPTRAQAVAGLDRALRPIVDSDAFGAWVDRLFAEVERS